MVYEKPKIERFLIINEDIICESNNGLTDKGDSDSWTGNTDIGDL